MDKTYFSEEEVRLAIEKLIIRINSGLFLQGVKSKIDKERTVENTINEMKSNHGKETHQERP